MDNINNKSHGDILRMEHITKIYGNGFVLLEQK